MPNQDVIVAVVLGIKTKIDRPIDQIFKDNPDGIPIEFEDNQHARLLPREHADDILKILEELSKMRAPVYVEVQPDSKEMMRLLIPIVSRVANISECETGEFEVEFEMSHARHELRRENPDFSKHLGTLRSAHENNAWLIVTETDSHEVIDVRLSPHEPELPVAKMPSARSKSCSSWFCRWFKWLCCWCECLRCVSERKARQMFDLVNAKTCDPLAVPPPCIPFLYPDDGCWARAHEMCRLILAAGVRPEKVWIDGYLHANTKNHPNCYVNWGWHVAPTICVRRGFCRVEDMVIDPSLFTGPVSKSAWKGVQGDPNATLTDSDYSLYWRNVMPSDSNYVDTNYRLQYYRLQLQLRALNSGPPPYAHCP